MNNKIQITLASIASIFIGPMGFSQITEANVIQTIAEFEVSQDYTKLSESYSAIGSDSLLLEETRAMLYIRILGAVNKYLVAHPKPEKTPTLNVAPPDGGLPGVDPANIKDPILRAQYIRDISANKELILSRSRHNVLSKMSDSIATYCASFKQIKPENNELLATYIRKQITDPLVIKRVVELLGKEEVQHAAEGATVPAEPEE